MTSAARRTSNQSNVGKYIASCSRVGLYNTCTHLKYLYRIIHLAYQTTRVQNNDYSTLFRTDDVVKLAYHFLFSSFHVISGTFFFISSLVCIHQYGVRYIAKSSLASFTRDTSTAGLGKSSLPTACMPKITPSNNPIVAVDPNPMGMVCVHSSASLGLKSTYPALYFFFPLHPRV